MGYFLPSMLNMKNTSRSDATQLMGEANNLDTAEVNCATKLPRKQNILLNVWHFV